MKREGRILAVKWGLNPNSSSLGVDVTFLIVGAAALSLFTPVISALVRWRAPGRDPAVAAAAERDDANAAGCDDANAAG